MRKKGIDTNKIVEKAAEIVNREGLEKLTLKEIASELEIKAPSIYNHVKGLEDIKYELMLYGWSQVEEKMLVAAEENSGNGYVAIEKMCRAFFDYSKENKGVFDAMLWYNKFSDERTMQATKKLFEKVEDIMSELNLPYETVQHLIRTLRSFLEGFSLLVNQKSFGNPVSIEESFDLSIKVIIEGIKKIGSDCESDCENLK